MPWAARLLGHDVSWVEDRREHFVSSAHERRQVQHVRVGFDDDGEDPRARRHPLARQRRLHALRHHRADHLLDPAAGALQAGRLPGRVLLPLHEHRHRHAVSRCRPPAGRVRHGADHRRDRRRARARPRRRPGGQPHPARRVPLRPGADVPGRPAADLRLRRLPGDVAQDQGPRRLGRLRRVPGGRARRGPPGRHRSRLLRRGHRGRAVRGRARPGRDVRAGERLHRAHDAGPGPSDRVRADRRRHPRRPAGGRARHLRRHPPVRVRRRDVRLAGRRDERQRRRPRGDPGAG